MELYHKSYDYNQPLSLNDKVDKSQVIGLGSIKTVKEKERASLLESIMETMDIELGIIRNSINLRTRFNEIIDELKLSNEILVNIMIKGKDEELKRVLNKSISWTIQSHNIDNEETMIKNIKKSIMLEAEHNLKI